jgi:hypothetical protein
MTSYTNVFGGSPVQPSDVSYRAISLTANTTLQWPFSFQDTANVTAHIMDVTPTANGYILTLPDATEASVGEDFLISNLAGSAYTFYVATVDSEGNSSNIVTVAQGAVYYLYLRDNTISEGEWGVTLFGQGTTAISSVTLDTTLNTDTITTLTFNGENTATLNSAGTITINVGNDLYALSGFETATGYAVRTNYSNSNGAVTWKLRTFTNSDGNVTITNPSGVIDNVANGTIIDLSSEVTITTSLYVGNSVTYTTLTDTALYATSTTNLLTLGNSNGPLFLSGGTTYGSLNLNASIAVTPGTGGNLVLGESSMTGSTTLYGPSSSSLTLSGGNIGVSANSGTSTLTGSKATILDSSYPTITVGSGNASISCSNGTFTLTGNNSSSISIGSTGNTSISSGGTLSLSGTSISLTGTLSSAQVLRAAAIFYPNNSSSFSGATASYNATVSRTGTGQYAVTFTTSMGTSNYFVTFGPYSNGSDLLVVAGARDFTQNGFNIYVWAVTSSGISMSDVGFVSFTIFSNS